MAVNSKVRFLKTAYGKFIYIKLPHVETFTCDICKALGKDEKGFLKSSKTRVEWVVPSKDLRYICNGCYGTLCLQIRDPDPHGKVVDAVKKLFNS